MVSVCADIQTSIFTSTAWLAGNWPALAEQGRRLIERLDPAMRARVLAALTGLVILGLGMMALAWLGARMTRRYMTRLDSRQTGRSTPSLQDDWARTRLFRDDLRDSGDSRHHPHSDPD
jgi:hypothetical protein